MTKNEIINYWVSSSDKDLKEWVAFLKMVIMDEVTTFNIKARYPDYKGRFYNKATKRFAEGYISRIKDFRRWLKKRVKE